MEGVHEGTQVGEASLQVRQREHAEPGEEKAGTDVGLEQEAQVVEGTLPARAAIPVGMNEERRAGGGWVRSREGRTLESDEGGHTHDQLPPALDRIVVGDPVVGPAQVVFGLLEAVLNGLFTNDKFCLSRFGQLTLTWWHYPLRLRGVRADLQTASPGEEAHRGGNDEQAVAHSPADVCSPGRAAPLGPRVSGDPGVGCRE